MKYLSQKNSHNEEEEEEGGTLENVLYGGDVKAYIQTKTSRLTHASAWLKANHNSSHKIGLSHRAA